MNVAATPQEQSNGWTHETAPDFRRYYEDNHDSPAARARFIPVMERVLEVRLRRGLSAERLSVLDIGCGPGAQCLLWAEGGHRVSGVDISADFVELARKRLERHGLNGDFETASATALPIGSSSKDVVLLPELLEHVADWQSVISEADRVLKPEGVLYLSTTNVLCPKQMEFELPLYSWYPDFVKRKVKRLSVTSHPHFANHAQYPAVNWFTYRGLIHHLEAMGYKCYTRFDLFRHEGRGKLTSPALRWARDSGLLGLAGQILTAFTVLYCVKDRR